MLRKAVLLGCVALFFVCAACSKNEGPLPQPADPGYSPADTGWCPEFEK